MSEQEAIAARESAIRSVGNHNPKFVEEMVNTIKVVALEKKTFIAADLWEKYRGPEPTDVRAMGAAVRKAMKLNLIEHSNSWVHSGRRSDHNDRVPVWNSKIYENQD